MRLRRFPKLTTSDPLPATVKAPATPIGYSFAPLNHDVLRDVHAVAKLLDCNLRSGTPLSTADIQKGVDAADVEAAMIQMLNGVGQALPPLLLADDDENTVGALNAEIQRAHNHGFIKMSDEQGKYMGNIGDDERAALHAAHAAHAANPTLFPAGYPILLKIVGRFDAVVAANPGLVVPFLHTSRPIILLREVPAGEHSTAAAAGDFAHLHCDVLHSILDVRLGLTPERISALLARDGGPMVFARCIFTIGAPTKTFVADLKGRTVLTAEALCDGGGICLDGPVRAQTPGAEQRFMHAGARDDMPCRLQLMPDFSIFCIKAYNRTMARFLLADAMERPKEETRALRAWLKAIIDAPA